MSVEESGVQIDSQAKPSQPSPPPKAGWVAPAALALAVVAVAVAVGGVFWTSTRTTDEAAVPASQPDNNSLQALTALQPDAAKAQACAASDLVLKAVAVQTNRNLGPQVLAKEVVAANSRLATLGGGQYLLTRLDPATPADLADAVRTLANNLQDVAMNQFFGTPKTDPALAPKLAEAQKASEKIATICK